MARTIVGLNDPKAVKKYSGLLAVDVPNKSFFGKLASIRYMSVGLVEKPRVPSFIGWRDEDDL